MHQEPLSRLPVRVVNGHGTKTTQHKQQRYLTLSVRGQPHILSAHPALTLVLAMHFASLILALATAAVVLATPAPAKRGDYYRSTFLNLDGATEASGYLTYKLVQNVPGNAMPLAPSDDD